MASFQLAPGEEFVQCPYNVSHMITNARILIHLDKCRRNYIKENKGREDKVACRFNFTHKINKPEVEFHESRCPDRHTIVPHIVYHQSEEFKAKASAQRAENAAKVAATKAKIEDGEDDDEEDWEKDCRGNSAGYDPSIKLSTGPVIPVVPQGMTKSERKEYRLRDSKRQIEYEATLSKMKKVEKKCVGEDPFDGQDDDD